MLLGILIFIGMITSLIGLVKDDERIILAGLTFALGVWGIGCIFVYGGT